MRFLLLVLLGSACVDVDPIDTEVAPKGKTTCSTCDDNGLPPDAWRVAPMELSPTALGPAPRVGFNLMLPLCEPGTLIGVPGGRACDLATAWSGWGATPGHPSRAVLVRYMIRVGARKGDRVIERSTSITTDGAFGLAPTVLTVPWDDRVQSIVTAGMAANVDMFANAIGICLKTRTTPDCPLTYEFMELAFAGNLFAGRLEVAVGGYAAEVPADSRRVCQGPGIPCNSYSATAPYHAATCDYAGPLHARHPLSCAAPRGGPRFTEAVQVFLETDPAVAGATPSFLPIL